MRSIKFFVLWPLLAITASSYSAGTLTKLIDAFNGLIYSEYKDRSNSVLQYDGIEGLWHGVYNCTQGDTNLILQVGAERHGYSTAVFMFFPTDYNPDVKSGSFKMKSKKHRSGAITFNPVDWIIKPYGYEMVSLTVHETTSRYHEIIKMHGTVDMPGCTEFSLNRL